MTHTYYDTHRRLRVQTHRHHHSNTHSTTMDQRHHDTAHTNRIDTSQTPERHPYYPLKGISHSEREDTNRSDRRGRGSVTEAVRGRMSGRMSEGPRPPIDGERLTAPPCAPSTAYAYLTPQGKLPHGLRVCSPMSQDNPVYPPIWDHVPSRRAIRFVDADGHGRPSLTETRNFDRRETGHLPKRVRSYKSEVVGGVGVFPSEGSARNGGVAG